MTNFGQSGEIDARVVTCSQGAASLMVWAAVTETRRSPLIFVEQGVKINQENYQNIILQQSLLLWATEHFKKHRWSFQQNFAPSHAAK